MKFIFVLVIILSWSAPLQQSSFPSAIQNDGETLKLIIPKDTWEPIFFEEINKRAKVAKLHDLRSTALPGDDLEIRVWKGFGLSPLEGLVLKRTSGRWSALHLAGIRRGMTPSEYQQQLSLPKSGWDSFWKRMTEEGILILPDSSELKGEKRIEDGVSYVVEINTDHTYRTYYYGNPDWQTWKEAKQMMKISNIIAAEFGLRGFIIEEHAD
ncbi:MAG: hypothetical protein ACJ741_05730 [Pyrinomonadaceae bacterium]